MSETAIQTLSDERAARVARGDFEAMAGAFYADDAVLLPSAASTVRGRSDLVVFWREQPEKGLVSLGLETREIQASDDLAYEIGRFNRTLRRRHGAPFQERGKYLVIYRRRQDGTWRAVAEMFNSDAPR